jgi:hypothetical protein
LQQANKRMRRQIQLLLIGRLRQQCKITACNIRKMQVEQSREKVKRRDKKYPALSLHSTYLYNVNTSDPYKFKYVPLPIEDKYLQLAFQHCERCA